MLYLFEDYALDADRRELLKADRPIAVQPQVFDVLAFLIANRGRVVSKDELSKPSGMAGLFRSCGFAAIEHALAEPNNFGSNAFVAGL